MQGSHTTYMIGQQIAAEDYPFYALIQAAMRQADTDNLEHLKTAWPLVWKELKVRYNIPGGFLDGEQPLVFLDEGD